MSIDQGNVPHFCQAISESSSSVDEYLPQIVALRPDMDDRPKRVTVTMPLKAEVVVAFALRIKLSDDFDSRALSAMIANLNAYEPSLFSLASAASEGGELPESKAKKARLSSVLEVDEDRAYPVFKYHDAVDSCDFEGPLMRAFEKAAITVLGEGHDVSVVLQKRFGKAEDASTYAMYLVHKPSMLAPHDVVYDEIRMPCSWLGLDFTDIPVDEVDANETKGHFLRLCRALGLEADGGSGWKFIASAGDEYV